MSHRPTHQVLSEKSIGLSVAIIPATFSPTEFSPRLRDAETLNSFARYAYVLAGTLRVTNTETGQSETYKQGDFIVEAIDQWHKAANIGADAVKLVVIDQVEGEQGNTVLR